MPGRPRLYSDAAERQREYRARQQERKQRQQASTERLRASVRELRAALEAAAQAGDPVAQAVLHLGINETLLNLAAHYRETAERALAAAPVTPSSGRASERSGSRPPQEGRKDQQP